jgi:hypothetical protein
MKHHREAQPSPEDRIGVTELARQPLAASDRLAAGFLSASAPMASRGRRMTPTGVRLDAVARGVR